MSAIDPPVCGLCKKAHWQRVGYVFETNTQREGRRVLKAEAARPDATRIASTEKFDPPQPPRARLPGKRGNAEKPSLGKRKAALVREEKRKRRKARKAK